MGFWGLCTHIYTQVYALKLTQISMNIFTNIQSHTSFICRYTHTHSHMHSHFQTYTQYRHTDILIYSLLRTSTYKNTLTYAHSPIHSPIHTHSHTNSLHLSSFLHIHICINMHIWTHEQLHAHTHTLVTCVHIHEKTYIYTPVHNQL